MAEPNFGIIVAAGRGKRFGGLKQFATVKKRPLLFYSLKAFETCPEVKGYVVVTNPSKIRNVRQMIKTYRFKKALAVVNGGRQRMDSVEQGLFALPEEGYVAVHDGARPMLKPEMLALGFRAVRKYPAVAFGIPVTDTLKETIKGRIVKTVDRTGLVAIQTPQLFLLSLLRRAYAQARNQGLVATDECQLIENLNISPRLLLGSTLNIKVTTKDDLKICEALL
ncbi:MAG: 2-C-methyl-D-erythritol 4-phosphate cytidylyltransferase [candidate division WOR-3 bacterium]